MPIENNITVESVVKDSLPISSKTSRLIMDLHGCLLHPVGNFAPEYIDRGLSDQEVDFFRYLKDEQYLFHFFQLTCPTSKRETLRVKKEESVLRYIHKFIDSYNIPTEIQESFLANSSEIKKGRLSIATGTPLVCKDELVVKLKESSIWPCLDPTYALFLNPTKEVAPEVWPTGRIFSVVSKMSAMGICSLLDGISPWVIEDTIEIAEYAAALFGAKVYVPLTYNEAVLRRKFESPIWINKNIKNGEIHFSSDVPTVLDNYKIYLKSSPIAFNQ